MTGCFLLSWLAVARAEIPPPDYRSEQAQAAADEIARRAQLPADSADGARANMVSAEDFADRWRRTLGGGPGRAVDDAKLAYELGLGWRLAGDETSALANLDRAIAEDPAMVAAHYDRGEIELNRGNADAAKREFETVVRLAPDGWPGHFRLADVARRANEADTFERELTSALRAGFSFRDLAADPSWLATFRDPTLGPILHRLITVYQGDDVLQQFENGP